MTGRAGRRGVLVNAGSFRPKATRMPPLLRMEKVDARRREAIQGMGDEETGTMQRRAGVCA